MKAPAQAARKVLLAIGVALLGAVLAIAGSMVLAMAAPDLVDAVARAVDACPPRTTPQARVRHSPYNDRRRRQGTSGPAFSCVDAEGYTVRPRRHPQTFLFLGIILPSCAAVYGVIRILRRRR